MLSILFKNENNIKTDINRFLEEIKNIDEKNKIEHIVFNSQKYPNVKCLQVDYNWGIDTDYNIVITAAMKIFKILNILKYNNFSDESIFKIRLYLENINSLLKNGLILYGCIRPPYNIENFQYSSEYIISLAFQVENYLQ